MWLDGWNTYLADAAPGRRSDAHGARVPRMAHSHGRGTGVVSRVLDKAVSHPLPRLRPMDVSIVARHDDLLLQGGKVGQLHQLGLLAGGIVVAMAVAALAVALGRGEDAVGVIGGGGGDLGIVARVVEQMAVAAAGHGLRPGARDVSTRRSGTAAASKLRHVWHVGWNGTRRGGGGEGRARRERRCPKESRCRLSRTVRPAQSSPDRVAIFLLPRTLDLLDGCAALGAAVVRERRRIAKEAAVLLFFVWVARTANTRCRQLSQAREDARSKAGTWSRGI